MRIPFITPLVWGQVLISACIVAVGLVSAHALSQVDADLQLLYREYTLAAVDLAHISADVLRYRVTIVRAIESANQQEFERLTGSLAMDRARIQHAVDRYAAASLRVSRSGRSEPQDLEVIRQSLDAYFCSASKSIMLLVQSWHASTPARRAALQHQAEMHAADHAGPKLIQLTLALDRLLETVADVSKDLGDEGARAVQNTGLVLTIGPITIALLNLLPFQPRGSLPELPERPIPGAGDS